jgi:hypothetical protein
MRRRTVLASVGSALLAGCLGSRSTGRSPSTTTDGLTTTTPTHGTVRGSDGFAVSEFDVSTTKLAPPKRYYLRITEVYSTDAVDREAGEQTVRDVSEIDDPELKETVETILSDGKVWREGIPQGLRELTERVDFFTWEANPDPDATATHWGIRVYRAHPERNPVVEFAAELVDDRVAPGDPGAIAFSVTNTGDRTQAVFSGTVPPFSVLWAEAPGGNDRALLWRDYAEEGGVSFGERDGESVLVTYDVGVTTPIAPGETVEKRYELRPGFDRDALTGYGFDAPGRYVVAETLNYHRHRESQGPSTEVDWSVEFELEAI